MWHAKTANYAHDFACNAQNAPKKPKDVAVPDDFDDDEPDPDAGPSHNGPPVLPIDGDEPFHSDPMPALSLLMTFAGSSDLVLPASGLLRSWQLTLPCLAGTSIAGWYERGHEG